MAKSKKDRYMELLHEWKFEGYDVSELEKKVKNKSFPYKAFQEHEEAILMLKDAEHDLEDVSGMEREKERIRCFLKDPSKAQMVRSWVNEMQTERKQDFFLSAIEEETVNLFSTKEETGSLADNIHPGFSYLIKEETPMTSFRTYEDLLKKGKKGLCITREFPDKVKKTFDLGKDPLIFWLSNVEHQTSINPVNLGNLYHLVEQFLKKEKDTVILLSGMEYLISQNTYQAILKLVQLLNDQVAVNQSILIVPVSPDALEEKHLKMLERELAPLE